jgi:hypothetical protein
MKSCMRRYGGSLKSKSIHGVSTKQHNNPHVMRAGRASGGACSEVGGGSASPNLGRAMHAKGGAVGRKSGGRVSNMASHLPQENSKADSARVVEGMYGKDKNRASGGGVGGNDGGGKVGGKAIKNMGADKANPKKFPGYKGETKGGKAAAGGMKLKSPGVQSGKLAFIEKGMGPKGKDEGLVKAGHDGTTNESGKKFAKGGKVEEKKDEDEDEADDEDDDEEDEVAAKKVGAHEERKHGGKVKKRAEGGQADSDFPDPDEPRERANVDNMINEAPSRDEINRQLGIKPKANVAQSGSSDVFGRARGGKTPNFNPGGEKGKLHRELGINPDDKIPAKRLAKAEHSKNPEIKRDAIRAETMKHWKH